MSFLYDVFIWTVPFLGMLTVIVFVHEMGHFLMGRVFKVPIDAFSIGFGPELLHWTDRHGTRWRLALLPLGGYVKFHGDGDPASMTRAEADTSVRGRTMQTQEVWKRALIVAAGPAVNFVLAIALFGGLFMFYGQMVTTPTIESVRADGAAKVAGFLPGDTVTAIDGIQISSLDELKRQIESDDGSPMTFVVKRSGQDVTLVATPRREAVTTMFGTIKTNIIGIAFNEQKSGRLVRYSPLQAIEEGTLQTWRVVDGTGRFLTRLVLGRESTEQLSGPVGIAKVTATAARHGIEYVVQITALVSVSIGLLNLLPIPILDGGFLMFFAFEAIRGRALSERTMEISFRIGLSLIATLSIFALYNDTIRPKLQPPVAVVDKK